MLHSKIHLVLYVIFYTTPICFSNLLPFCMEKGKPTSESCQIIRNETFLTAAEERDEHGVVRLDLVTAMANCDFNHISALLEVTNATEEKECAIVDADNRIKHSYEEYEFESEKWCKKSNYTIKMERIYKGCYIITFSPYRLDGNRKLTVQPLVFKKWLSNNYTVENFLMKKPTLTTDTSRKKIFSLDVYFDTTIIQNHWNYSIQIFNSMANDPSEIEEDVKDNCTVAETKITCVFQDLPIGNYTLLFQLEDVPWCVYIDGVFHSMCRWMADFNIEPLVPQNTANGLNHDVQPESDIVQSVLIFLLCIGMLVLFVLVYVTRQKRYSRKKIIVTQWKNTPLVQESEIKLDAQNNESVTGILVLYARDCRAFMRAMKHFRELLQAETGLEVFDLFDHKRFEEICASPNEWIQGLLQDPHIKTVLVGTQCVDLMYRNLMKRFAQGHKDEHNCISTCTLYKMPEFLDGVVLHAVKMVSFDINLQRPYQKYFVTYIPNFSDDNTLSQINPFKRYALPDTAMHLIADLCRAPIVALPDTSPDAPQAPHTLHVLGDSLARLCDYVASHPHYLHRDLLE